MSDFEINVDDLDALEEAQREVALRAEVERRVAQAHRLEDESNEARRVAIVVESERDQARADLARAIEEREELRAECGRNQEALADMARFTSELRAERDRLRAVLAETPENVALVIASVVIPEIGDAVWDAARILAALRARAGTEPTP